jgi:hypothetical protein
MSDEIQWLIDRIYRGKIRKNRYRKTPMNMTSQFPTAFRQEVTGGNSITDPSLIKDREIFTPESNPDCITQKNLKHTIKDIHVE